MSVFKLDDWLISRAEKEAFSEHLLAKTEPSPAALFNKSGKGSYVFGCEHASNQIPKSLGSLGLSEAELNKHIAWDIGAAKLTQLLADSLDCPAVFQRYSRLVYDCNRTMNHEGAFVVEGDGIFVGGNANLNFEDKVARERTFYQSFHQELTDLIERRRRNAENFGYVAVHSFNETVRGQQRPWHIGMIYNQQSQMSKFLVRWFRNNTGYLVGENEPYSPLDSVDHTIRVQAEVRAIPYTMIEVRNDMLQTGAGILHWAALLTDALDEYAREHLQ